MDKWQYLKCISYRKEEKGKGAFSTKETHEYLLVGGEEYNLYKDANVPKALNYLGNKGWELVSTTPIIGQEPIYSGAGGLAVGLTAGPVARTTSTTTQEILLWFKRKVEQTPES